MQGPGNNAIIGDLLVGISKSSSFEKIQMVKLKLDLLNCLVKP